MDKIYKCSWCGAGFYGGGKCCSTPCAERAVQDSIKQLRDKKGVIYEKWRKGLEESIKRL